jgi:GNAT superfamily N-acetyltransferase
MIHLKRTDSSNSHFIHLVSQLDLDLRQRDGAEHKFYAEFNKIERIRHAVVAYLDALPVGCGAFKEYETKSAEIKRMYVLPEYRSQKIATAILRELEEWARELSFTSCVLETGKRQPEAIGLYQKCGYKRIPNFGQYKDVANSVCFMKNLN